MLKIEAEIYEIKEGQLTKIKHEGRIYNIESSKKPSPITTSPVIPPKKEADDQQQTQQNDEDETIKRPLDRGNLIAELGHNQVYDKILEKIQPAIEAGKSDEELKTILKLFYEEGKEPQDKSLQVYVSLYKRYLREQGIKVPQPTTPTQSTLNDKPKTHTKRRGKHKKFLPGQVGVDDSYGVRIFQDEINKVKEAVGKWNEIHDSHQIMRDSGLRKEKLNAVLHWMRTHGQLKRTLTSEHGYIYELM